MNRSRRKRPTRRDGFTMVELLVAMTVTLILIFALAQAFAIVGESVAKGRAAIEMGGNLRMVANRLQRDLNHITVPMRPGVDYGSGHGYLEILDGPRTDKDWDGNGINELAEDRNSNSTADVLEDPPPQGTHTEFGDLDDVIAFTTRDVESPFFGRANMTKPVGPGQTPPAGGGSYTWDTYQSPLAEVVWWIQYEDLSVPPNGIRDPEEPFLIYRRAMIIRPDLVDLPIRQLSAATNIANNPSPGVLRGFTFADGVVINQYSDGRIVAVYQNTQLAELRDDLLSFYSNNDVSVRLIWTISGSDVNVRLACNSLADLTKRESRYAHVTILADRPSLALVSVPAAQQYPFLLDTNRRSVTSLYRNTKRGDNLGEDVMVSNALAFDVQVFDPGAPILNWNTGDALVPSDPAYFHTTWTTPPLSPPLTSPTATPHTIGYGAFVDLGYGSRAHANASGWSFFSGMPNTKSKLYLGNTPIYDYCTWSDHYEKNHVDEDSDNLKDEGTNGFDDNGTDGVDDVGERETSPPYPVPLRGIQIRIRTWDPDSRQIRQATVVSDFVPE